MQYNYFFQSDTYEHIKKFPGAKLQITNFVCCNFANSLFNYGKNKYTISSDKHFLESKFFRLAFILLALVEICVQKCPMNVFKVKMDGVFLGSPSDFCTL